MEISTAIFPCLWIKKLSWKFPDILPLSLHSKTVVEISRPFCLCLWIQKLSWKFSRPFVLANTEMVLEIFNTFCVCKYLNGIGNFQYILCLQILKWSWKFPRPFPRLGCLTHFLAKNYQTFQRLGNFSNKYDNLCHKFLFLSINGVCSHFIATLLLQNMEHLVKSLPYYLKSQENW